MEHDNNCICQGNWRLIVKESEPLINRLFRETDTEKLFSLFGLVHGGDDYYYGMIDINSGQIRLLSCVGNIEQFNFQLIDEKVVCPYCNNGERKENCWKCQARGFVYKCGLCEDVLKHKSWCQICQ